MDTLAGMKRTHSCGALGASDAGTEVVLCGWVSRQRDHGGLIFIDLRDRSGTIQLVFSPEINQAALLKADAIRTEFVISVRGAVRLRSPETVNPAMPATLLRCPLATAAPCSRIPDSVPPQGAG